MTYLHHNDIMSANVNIASPWGHCGPLEDNLELGSISMSILFHGNVYFYLQQ